MQNDREPMIQAQATDKDFSLLDILDHVLNAGVVIQGSLVLSIAGVDLVYLGLNVVLSSVETALKNLNPARRLEIGQEE
jgi:hypothetical protein